MPETTERSPRIDRRTLVRTAAWSVPVVATAAAAPAFAASCVTTYPGAFDWGSTANYTPATQATQTTTSGSMTFDNGVTTTVSLTSTVNGYTRDSTNAVPTVSPNLGVSPTTVGGTAYRGLVICQSINSAANLSNAAFNQTVRIAFGRPVYDVRVSLADLDGGANQFWDAVAIATEPAGGFTSSVPTGSTVIGAGSTAAVTSNATGPFRPSSATTAFDNQASNGGNVDLVMAGPINAFSIIYWNRSSSISSGSSKQTVYVTRMTARTLNAGC